jgi:hypothetical protein
MISSESISRKSECCVKKMEEEFFRKFAVGPRRKMDSTGESRRGVRIIFLDALVKVLLLRVYLYI